MNPIQWHQVLSSLPPKKESYIPPWERETAQRQKIREDSQRIVEEAFKASRTEENIARVIKQQLKR